MKSEFDALEFNTEEDYDNRKRAMNAHKFNDYHLMDIPELKKLPEIEYVNNIDFYKDLSVIDFLRDIGKHYRVSSMLQKDSVKTRMEGGSESDPNSGMSFTEFSYQMF